ncbi:PB1 domain, RWP-RK domain protein [Tanacetum coccineum]
MLTGKWTPMNTAVLKFNQLVQETAVHSGENDDDHMSRVYMLYDATVGEPGHFGDDELPRPPGLQRLAKSQRAGSNSTASSGSNPALYQEFMSKQYELDRKAKMTVLERESEDRRRLIQSQRIAEDMRKDVVRSTLLLLQEQPTKNQSPSLAISSAYMGKKNLCRPVYSRYMLHDQLPENSKSHMLSNTHTTTSDGIITEEKKSYTQQRRKPKMDSVTMEAIQQNFGKPIGEASKRLGVSRSTLKRVCRKLDIPSWPKPRRNMKYKHPSIYVVVLLLVKVKRWSCSSNRHGFAARWWICGKHSAFVSEPNLTIEPRASSMISNSSKESDDSIETLNPIPKPPQARSDMFPASPEKNVATVSHDIRMVTVKATYKDDMIKFQFPLSSGLLELKQEMARRFMFENTRLRLKYMDEDGDVILVACDADLRILMMPYSATTVGNNTIRLMVEIADV